MRKLGFFGFTLIELLVVIAIAGTLLTVLYSSFQIGLRAYTSTERGLVENREGDIFLLQLEQELKNAIPYYTPDATPAIFGTKDAFSFTTHISRYTPKGFEDDLFVVRYEVKGKSLVRKERQLNEGTLKGPKEEKEVLFQKLTAHRFDFLYLDRDEKLVWESEWSNKPYVGLPRGVRLTLAGDVFGKKEQTFEILIPHGILLEHYQGVG